MRESSASECVAAMLACSAASVCSASAFSTTSSISDTLQACTVPKKPQAAFLEPSLHPDYVGAFYILAELARYAFEHRPLSLAATASKATGWDRALFIWV